MSSLDPAADTGPVSVVFGRIVRRVVEECCRYYGERLVSLAVFGSVGRGVMRPDSDIDLLLVVNPLPDGRVSRVREFEAVESELAADIKSASFAGVTTRLSPVFKTPSEVRAGSPLFLDMVEDALILHDADGFMAAELGLLRTRLEKLGARRVRRASAWFWDLKPDYSPGDVFEI